MQIELIGASVCVKADDLSAVFTISELIELVRWAIDHEVELQAKVWERKEPLEGISGL